MTGTKKPHVVAALFSPLLNGFLRPAGNVADGLILLLASNDANLYFFTLYSGISKHSKIDTTLAEHHLTNPPAPRLDAYPRHSRQALAVA